MTQLNIIQRTILSRQLAIEKSRLARIEALLAGQPLAAVKFADAIITSAKIAGLSADKITSGTLSVGEKILVSDGVNNRIRITRDEIRISKPGVDVEQTITETNKKDFVILDTTEADKLVYAGIVQATTYNHNFGYVPWFYAFTVNSASNPTTFTRKILGVRVTDSVISGLSDPSYIMLYHKT